MVVKLGILAGSPGTVSVGFRQHSVGPEEGGATAQKVAAVSSPIFRALRWMKDQMKAAGKSVKKWTVFLVVKGGGALLSKLVFSPLSFSNWVSEIAGKISGHLSPRQILKQDYLEEFRKQFANFEYNSFKKNREGQQELVKGELAKILIDQDRELEHFEKAVQAFSDRIETLAGDPGKMRAAIVELSRHPMYLLLKETHHPAVEFVQECAMHLESTDGQKAFKAYGEARIGKHLPDEKESVSFSEFAEALGKAQTDIPHNRDSLLATAEWSGSEIGTAMHVSYGHIKTVEYESYHNHTVFEGMPLTDSDGGRTMIHKYTPGLTGDQTLVPHVLLPHLKKQKKKWVHIDNQSPHKKDEQQRLREIHGWATQYPDDFLHVVIATDPSPKTKASIEKFKDGKLEFISFLEEYEKGIRGENNEYIRDFDSTRGIYIPKELLDDVELDAAFETAQSMVLANPLAPKLMGTPKDRKILAQVFQTTLNSVLSWAIMKKQQLKEDGAFLFTENCKEHIDRGPRENLGVVFFNLLTNGAKDLSVEQANLFGAFALGRGEYAANRAMQAKRLHPLLHMLEFFGNEEVVQDASEQLKKLRLCFVPGSENRQNAEMRLRERTEAQLKRQKMKQRQSGQEEAFQRYLEKLRTSPLPPVTPAQA